MIGLNTLKITYRKSPPEPCQSGRFNRISIPENQKDSKQLSSGNSPCSGHGFGFFFDPLTGSPPLASAVHLILGTSSDLISNGISGANQLLLLTSQQGLPRKFKIRVKHLAICAHLITSGLKSLQNLIYIMIFLSDTNYI